MKVSNRNDVIHSQCTDAINECLRGSSLSISIISRGIQVYGQPYLAKVISPVLKRMSRRSRYEVSKVSSKKLPLQKRRKA